MSPAKYSMLTPIEKNKLIDDWYIRLKEFPKQLCEKYKCNDIDQMYSECKYWYEFEKNEYGQDFYDVSKEEQERRIRERAIEVWKQL